ncbi:MAG: winged helix-turn-helix transcriptional regulator [Gammaproteobacteria bacterium]|nr:winged helix-turn-helix transcriptional regulator [Gammaproteobacteria bacterium]
MRNHTYSDIPVKGLAQLFKLLAEPNRLHILCSMGLECRPVSAIVADTGLTQTNVSFHLRALREAGLVKAERQGSFVFYCLYDTRLLELLEDLNGWRLVHGTQTESTAA